MLTNIHTLMNKHTNKHDKSQYPVMDVISNLWRTANNTYHAPPQKNKQLLTLWQRLETSSSAKHQHNVHCAVIN